MERINLDFLGTKTQKLGDWETAFMAGYEGHAADGHNPDGWEEGRAVYEGKPSRYYVEEGQVKRLQGQALRDFLQKTRGY